MEKKVENTVFVTLFVTPPKNTHATFTRNFPETYSKTPSKSLIADHKCCVFAYTLYKGYNR